MMANIPISTYKDDDVRNDPFNTKIITPGVKYLNSSNDAGNRLKQIATRYIMIQTGPLRCLKRLITLTIR